MDGDWMFVVCVADSGVRWLRGNWVWLWSRLP